MQKSLLFLSLLCAETLSGPIDCYQAAKETFASSSALFRSLMEDPLYPDIEAARDLLRNSSLLLEKCTSSKLDLKDYMPCTDLIGPLLEILREIRIDYDSSDPKAADRMITNAFTLSGLATDVMFTCRKLGMTIRPQPEL